MSQRADAKGDIEKGPQKRSDSGSDDSAAKRAKEAKARAAGDRGAEQRRAAGKAPSNFSEMADDAAYTKRRQAGDANNDDAASRAKRAKIRSQGDRIAAERAIDREENPKPSPDFEEVPDPRMIAMHEFNLDNDDFDSKASARELKARGLDKDVSPEMRSKADEMLEYWRSKKKS